MHTSERKCFLSVLQTYTHFSLEKIKRHFLHNYLPILCILYYIIYVLHLVYNIIFVRLVEEAVTYFSLGILESCSFFPSLFCRIFSLLALYLFILILSKLSKACLHIDAYIRAHDLLFSYTSRFSFARWNLSLEILFCSHQERKFTFHIQKHIFWENDLLRETQSQKM